jgi:hypothetical protein
LNSSEFVYYKGFRILERDFFSLFGCGPKPSRWPSLACLTLTPRKPGSGPACGPCQPRAGLHRPHDEQSPNGARVATLKKSCFFFLISNESVMNPNGKHVDRKSAPITTCRVMNPYIRSHPKRFYPSETSSSPSAAPCRRCNATHHPKPRQLSRHLRRSPPLS